MFIFMFYNELEVFFFVFFFQAEDGIRDYKVTGVQTCALPISAVSATASAVPPLRILIVDDDPLVLKSLRDTLEADGHGVTTADGGRAGIDAFLAAKA